MRLDEIATGMNEERTAESLTDAERYRVLVDAIADYAIYMLDPDGRVASWNPGARRFKGYEAHEILGHYFGRFYTDEDRATGLPERALHTAATVGRFENQGWRVRKDGTRFWANVVIDPIWSPDGGLIGYAKITRDLTDQREQQEALRRSEEQFRLLVDGVTDYALYMLDATGLISSWNSGAERIKGYRPSEVIGRHFSIFYTDEDREAGLPQQALDTAVNVGRFERDGWRVRKDGSRFWASVVIDAIHNDEGELIGFAKITRDITERRDAQLSLDRAREQLMQAQKLEAIGQLTGGVAHDFNNLLTAILSSLELVRKYLPPDQRILRLIENAEEGARRGATLTQRLLAYARRQPLQMQSVHVPGLIEGLSALIMPSLGPDVRLDTRFEDQDLTAVTDANQLETAVLNLCVNSRDAMPDGGVITISGRAVTLGEGNSLGLTPGDFVCLSVTDQGEGMDAETLAKATEPFFTTKGVGKGSGLGVPMVHGLAAQSGGKLVLSSIKGQGTTAELWLRSADMPAESTAVRPEETAPDAGKTLNVLAVDDDALVLMNTAMMLEDLGHTVTEVTNGEQALKVLRSGEAIDLVISDHAMPGMTGSQLAAAIRESWPDLPVLLATGYAELPSGGDMELPRLSKPFSQKDLASAVADILRR